MRMKMCNCNIADTAGSWNEGQRGNIESMGGILINNDDGENNNKDDGENNKK